jgi:dihydroxyacetone kinase-like protein
VIEMLDTAGAQAWVETFVSAFESSSTELTELDRQAGDGDFGTNLLGPLGRARSALAESSPATVADVFGAVSKAMMRAGGSSGPLLGGWFREIARAAGEADAIGLGALAEGMTAGAAAVQRLGGARVGDSTMVDAMAPAAEALTEAARSGGELGAGLRAAALAARSGADSTAALVAKRGRASYVGEVGRGVLDPGAVAIAMFFEAAPGVEQAPTPQETTREGN